MLTFAILLSAVCGYGLLHTYVVFPRLTRRRAAGRKLDTLHYTDADAEWPRVTVLMAVFNEELVLRDKLDALLTLNYPRHRLSIRVGSDNSTDATNDILHEYAGLEACLHPRYFQSRQGKPGIINQLARAALADPPPGSGPHLFLLTDASVMPRPDALLKMARHFKTPQPALVDAHMVHTGLQSSGISQSEDRYISSEVHLKQAESILYRRLVGPFGGCYLLRADYYAEVPDNHLVDDFYICMKAYERGGLGINDLEAVCYEAVGHEEREEFRRKVRISAGNWQNLVAFRKLWWPPFSGFSYAFFSHKILRWLGPFFLIGLIIGLGLLAWLTDNQLLDGAFVLLLAGLAVPPLLDRGLRAAHVHWRPLRNVSYFLSMNLALLVGFGRYLKGIQTNVWQPSKRY